MQLAIKRGVPRSEVTRPLVKGELALVEADAAEPVPASQPSPQVSEIRELLSLLRDSVLEVEQLRGQMPTLPPKTAEAGAVAAAERSLRSLRPRW